MYICWLPTTQSTATDTTMPLELLQQWLYGNFAAFDKTSSDWEAASVVRIIVAGNSVRAATERRQRSNLMRQPESDQTLRAVMAVDEILSNWTRSVPVDLMSGEFDPSNFMLPQQPMHHCMFPKCALTQHFRAVTNPYHLQLADRRIVGTSGQNVNDIMRFTRIAEPLEALRSCLKWSHLAPTAPDSLPCFPYYEKDPFVLDECPHIMFVGNSSGFASDLHVGNDGQRTRLICVPAFAHRKSVVVVNLRTLECRELNFHLTDFDDIEE